MDREQYLNLLEPAIATVIKKSEDYRAGAVTLGQYFPFGDKSYIQMLHVKTLRLVSLADNPKPNFESVEDTVLDMINYGVFYLDYLRKKYNEQL